MSKLTTVNLKIFEKDLNIFKSTAHLGIWFASEPQKSKLLIIIYIPKPMLCLSLQCYHCLFSLCHRHLMNVATGRSVLMANFVIGMTGVVVLNVTAMNLATDTYAQMAPHVMWIWSRIEVDRPITSKSCHYKFQTILLLRLQKQ